MGPKPNSLSFKDAIMPLFFAAGVRMRFPVACAVLFLHMATWQGRWHVSWFCCEVQHMELVYAKRIVGTDEVVISSFSFVSLGLGCGVCLVLAEVVLSVHHSFLLNEATCNLAECAEGSNLSASWVCSFRKRSRRNSHRPPACWNSSVLQLANNSMWRAPWATITNDYNETLVEP